MDKKLQVTLVSTSFSTSLSGSYSVEAVHTYPGDYTIELPYSSFDDSLKYNANHYVVRSQSSNGSDVVAMYPAHQVKYVCYVTPQIPSNQ